jgi:ABC-type Fe3+-hydroxamate transport system substrate-binding protein
MKKDFQDQMGRSIDIEWPPKRIISLVPSQTELLHWLGLGEEVIAITKFCVHPEEWFHSKDRIGGTKKFDFEKIAALKPDLIIGNKEENEEEQIKQLMEKYPVWMSDIHDLEDAYEMMRRVGEVVDRKDKAIELVSEIKEAFVNLKLLKKPAKRAAYFIWRDPYMVAGHDTFLNNMLKQCNLENVFEFNEGRYPSVSKENIKEKSPELILLSSEPYPFKPKHIDELRQICPTSKIGLVDGEYFSWYGSRLLDAPAYFNKVLSEIE